MHTRRAVSAATLGLVLLLGGCETLRQSPKVDLFEAPPKPVVQARPVAVPVNGSLFHSASYRPVFEDPRARLPGDILTIQIVENISASQQSTSSIDRSNKLDSSVSALPLLPKSLTDRATAGASSSNVFTGKGGTESANTFTGTIAATVTEVLPNGHLVLVGEKQIGVNENVDVLRFSGTVDPRFILPGNQVPSSQVANARILSRARGAQGEAQSIGWLSRTFLNVLPF
jgi:flagellar L-ring protein FlgH